MFNEMRPGPLWVTSAGTDVITTTMITDATITGADLAANISITTSGATALNGAITAGGALTATSTIDLTGATIKGTSPLVFEGGTVDGTNKLTFALAAEPGAAFTVTVPLESGTLVHSVPGRRMRHFIEQSS